MKITVQNTGQIATLTGVTEEQVELAEGATLRDLVAELVSRHGSQYSDLVTTKQGDLRPSLLVIFDGEQAVGDPSTLHLDEVKTVMLMTPIAGG